MSEMYPGTKPSRPFHVLWAYWLMSSEGSNANAHVQHASRIASEKTVCVRAFPIRKYILDQSASFVPPSSSHAVTLNIEQINNRRRSGELSWLFQKTRFRGYIMTRSSISRSAVLPIVFFLVAGIILPAHGQTETATIYGSVTDPTGAVVPSAIVRLIDTDRGLKSDAATDSSGFYSFASVRPGRYRMEVEKAGFKLARLTGITANVQDNLEQNFKLALGAASETITVEASAVNVNTTDGTVSTVVDRQFAENLPLNGRSFQSLIELTPGVVVTTSNLLDNGQFSVNGQRADSNYWMVDGVSANFGLGLNSLYGGNGVAGALPATSVLGGTNSLVS